VKKILLWILTFSILSSASATWWDSDWEYRQQIDITENSGNNLTDYQVRIRLNATELYEAGKLRSDCGDIRFIDGSSELIYWVGKCVTDDRSSLSDVWVKVPLIRANSTKTIYMYHGNPNATTESNYSGTMKVPPNVGWEAIWYPYSGAHRPYAGIEMDSSGNIWVSGRSHTVKYDKNGTLLMNFSNPVIEAMTIDSSDNILLCGSYNNNYSIFAYDSDGNYLWNTSYDTSYSGTCRGLAVDSSGNIYSTGRIRQDGDIGYLSHRIPLVKHDSAGNHLWNKTVYTGIYVSGNGITVDSEDNIIVVGHTATHRWSGYSYQYIPVYFLIAKYDSDGNHLWTKTFTSGEKLPYDIDEGTAVITDQSNNIYTVGRFGRYYFTAKYSPDGTHIWNRTHPTYWSNEALDVDIDSIGNIITTGYDKWETTHNERWCTIKYTSVGDKLWSQHWGAGAHTFGVVSDPEDYTIMYVTGDRGYGLFGTEPFKYHTKKYVEREIITPEPTVTFVTEKNQPAIPDLTLTRDDITFSPSSPVEGDLVTINATVHNIGDGNAENVTVRFLEGSITLTNLTIDSINANASVTVSINWTATYGNHTITVAIDPDDLIPEGNESNNQASKEIEVISPTFKVLVVATYYQDESLWDIKQYESKLNESLENTKEYYLEQSYGHDYVWFSDPVYLQMPYMSGYYYDWPISALDKSYTPHPKYAWDVRDTLGEMGYDQGEYDAILTYQTDINSHSYEGGFRAVMYRFPAIKKDDKPIIAANIKDSYGTFAHELGHALYGFDDFYSEKLLILERNRGEVEYWGLMGRGGRLASKAPIISFNKVRADWLGYDPISGESIATQEWVIFTIYPYEDMDYGDSIIKIAGLEDPGIDYSYDFILELRRKHLDEYTPGGVPPFPTYWIEEPGVLIYQDHHGLLGSYLETIPAISLPPNPTNLHYLQTISDFLPSYKHPVTGLEFEYLGDSDPSPEVFEPPVKIKVGFDVSTYSDMNGIILNNLDIYDLKNLSLAPLVNITYPDIDLHAYTPDGKHVGMNYSSGVYENEIPGAISSGDLIAEEWIFVPSNLDVRFVVDSHDVQQYLEEINSSETLITNYTIQMMEYGENPSVEVVNNIVIITDRIIHEPTQKIIEPGQRENPLDDIAPNTSIELIGSAGTNGWYLSDVTVTLMR